MDYDHNKVDQTVLALLTLTMFDERPGVRAWKGHDWDVLDRLHAKGYISNPRNKSKSVVLSDEGVRLAEELFEQHFGVKD